MKAFACFKKETWYTYLTFVEKVAKNIGVKYLLVRQDLFDRTVVAKGLKTKDSKDIVRAFSTLIAKKNLPKKNWFDKGTECAGEHENICNAQGFQIYSTMSETKVAFAEHSIRSIKFVFYRYMEGYRYRYVQKFATILNSRKEYSIDSKPKDVKKSYFLSIVYRKRQQEYRKPKYKTGDKLRISMYDLSFRKGYKSKFTQFKIAAIST